MEKVIFKLKEPQKGVPKSKQYPTPVNMFFSFGYYEITARREKKYIPLKYSTGMNILPYYWNDKPIYRAKQTKEFAYENFNIKLDNLQNSIINLKRKLENRGELPTPILLRKELQKLYGKGPIVIDISLLSFIEQFIKESSEGSRHNKQGRRISSSTISTYKTTQKHLLDFQMSSGLPINFDSITMSFYRNFVAFLQNKGFMPNTIGKNIKNIKAFMKEASKRGLTKNQSFKDEDFVVFQVDTDHEYLNNDELQVLFNLDLGANQRLDKVRDLFLFACYTGLRFSDVSQIRKEHFINNKSRIKIKTIKTNDTVEIPVHWIVKEIYDKYDGDFPQHISNQKFNKYLKELCELAGIIEPVIVVKTKGGLRYDEKVPKNRVISTHTARRSFATNMFHAKVDPMIIRKITGHRTEKAFLRYIQLNSKDAADILANHSAFQKKVNKSN